MPLEDHTEKLIYFVAVAEAGSFQGASRRLGIAQPALSRSIKLLEAAAGCKLMIRNRQGAQLTAAGVELLQFTREWHYKLKLLESRISGGQGGHVGKITIASHEILVGTFWPALIKRLESVAPQLDLQLQTLSSIGHMEKRLQSYRCDLIIGVELPESESINRQELFTDTYGLFASPALARKVRRASNPSKFPIIYLPDAVAGPGKTLSHVLRESGLEAQSNYAVETFESVATLAAEGLGVAVLPFRPTRENRLYKNVLTPIFPPSHKFNRLGTHRIYSAIRKADGINASLRIVLEQLTGTE